MHVLKLLSLTALLSTLVTAQTLDDPNSTRGYLRTSNDLTFCIDKQNPTWKFEVDIDTAIAHSLGRKANFYVHREALPDIDTIGQPLDRDELLRLFAHHCDVYSGLVGSTTAAFDYPSDEQIFATRPYLRVNYVFASRSPGVTTLKTLPKTLPVSLELGGIPEYFMYTLRKGTFTGRTVHTAGRLASDLATGKAKSGIIFATQLYSRYPDPQKVGLSVNGITELPNMSWFVIAGVRRERPTLRQEVDKAINRLLQRGEVAKLLKKHRLNSPYIVPAKLTDVRPASESFDDDDK